MNDKNPFADWPYLDKNSAPDGARRLSPPPAFAPQPEAAPPPARSALEEFLGGAPLAVLARLFFVSLVVGALLMWLDLRPMDLVRGVQEFFRRVYDLGFGAIREMFGYVLAGAVIVVPAWLLLRLFGLGSRR